jgi:ABC-type transport system involved in cytochrome c biogenesis ATPase subunit
MNDNNKLNKRLKESLDKDVEALSAAVQTRLTQARIQALNEFPITQHKYLFGFSFNPIKVSAVFASLLFVVFSSFFILDSSNMSLDKNGGENLATDELIEAHVVNGIIGKEFFKTEEDLDFFENLELYQWLDTEFKIS